MKRIPALILLGSLAAAGGAAATGSRSLNQFKSSVMPVLVQVNAKGKVTRVSPSIHLSPRYHRLLRNNIEELVTGPAREKNKAVSSQFVMNVTLKTTPRPDGSYDVQFGYVSTKPVPSGPMHWVAIDGHRLALAGESDTFRMRNHASSWQAPRQVNPSQYRNYSSRPVPAQASRSAPSNSSNSGGKSRAH
jgi:hypothetical protein